MPTIGHLAVGLAAGRAFSRSDEETPRAMLLGALLATAPDWDLLTSLLAVPEGSPLAHRVATHSLVFAVAAGVSVGVWLGPTLRGRLQTAIWAVVTLASHGVLDLLNIGGRVAILWPFSSYAYESPWQFIPGTAQTRDLLTTRVIPILGAEALIFAPLFAYAIWGPRLSWKSQEIEKIEEAEPV
jgi:inner membrane protein